MKRVFVVSHLFPKGDWPEVIGHEEVALTVGSFEQLLEANVREKLDLFIFAQEGRLVRGAFQKNRDNPLLPAFLENHALRKVAWSLDSHNQWPLEIQCQQFFDTYYTAHSPYMEKFEPGKAKWLPCALQFDGSRRDILEILASRPPKSVDVVSMYRDYVSDGDRTGAVWPCWQVMQQMGLKVLLGQTDQTRPDGIRRYYEALLAGRVILNLSIKDDLNMRTLEALALNQVMVANRVPDHAKLDLDYRNVVFFDKGDMAGFSRALQEALAKAKQPVKSTVASVLNAHTLIHRFVTMINQELGMKLLVPDIDVAVELEQLRIKVPAAVAFEPSAEKGDAIYQEPDVGIAAACNLVYCQRATEALMVLLQLLRLHIAPAEWRLRTRGISFLVQAVWMSQGRDLVHELLRQAVLAIVQQLLAGGVSLKFLAGLMKDWPQLMEPAYDVRQQLGQMTGGILVKAAENLAAHEDWKEAAEFMDRAEELGVVLNANQYYLAARIYRLNGEPAKAVTAYEKSLKKTL